MMAHSTGSISLETIMQTSETGSDTGSTVTLQTSVASQAAVPTQVVQQVPVQQQVQQVQTVQQVQHVYPAQVQYVEGSDTVYTNGAIRTTTYPYTETQMYSQNTGGNYFDTQGSSAQVTTVVSSHSMVGTGGIQMGVTGGQLISSSGGTYLIGNSMENSGHSVTHTTRASPATIEMAIETLQKSDGLSTHRSSLLNSHLQWLLDNYETAEGVSLPRSTLYNHYLRHCQEHKLDPVNAASFGKLIRSIFMGLRTRRLGTRGNSKYHYYGIRVKPDSPLNRLQEDMQYMAMRQQPMQQKQRYKPMQKVDGVADGFTGSGQQTGTSVEQTVIAQSQHHQQFLDASRALPEFGEVEISSLPDGTTFEDIKSLQSLYREHCEAILDVVVNLQFSLIEKLWQTFWRYSPSTPADGTTITESSNLSEIESRLPKAKLITLCKHESILKWMCNCDHGMYQALVEILIPDVLRPIPSALTQAIRNFAKSLEGWLSNAMNNIPQRMIQTKVAAVSAFAQTLRRYTSLNHLAQAARAVLQNTSQINQMLNDLNRVDFANVQEQASWVCQCDDNMVQRLETDFKMTLQQQSTLEQWAAWLDNVMMQALKPYEGRPSFPKAARQFLLKWSFYSSMVIRDLTLRSAASFGSFHLIRLLYDEYMFYLVEHRVAQATGETPIAVMGEFGDLNAVSPGNLDKDEGSEVESEMDEELDDSSEPQAKREKTELNQAFPVGCMQPVLESGVQPSLLNPIHSEHIVTSTQTIRQCSATGNTYTAV
ncbi:transcription factor RFX3 isoform X3 [Globicephala melas]|nr:transcription factor RFX3 isoform X1 [Tursiops truncatus]XP_022429307.1 transcription factor RFX3 isoform X4 [Delphinapterus leucas]XP_029057395.1 transcription factor RFX3 isoform X1 [Monodon monoceros]XP_029057396.1 transcription factor RFX3 isoform X1 [Monodon monoceros]XP_060155970.1 transcription factor RFX3 isoform X3 [Globicephala melas]